MVEQPHLAPLAPIVLYETLGPTLGEGREGAAAVWGLAQTCFLSHAESVQRAGYADGDALFDAMIANPSGVVFTLDDYEETWKRLDTPDGKVSLVIPDLLEELSSLPPDVPADLDFPFVLSRESVAPPRRTRSSAIPRGGRRMAASRCASTQRTPQHRSRRRWKSAGRGAPRIGRGTGRDHRCDATWPCQPAERPRPHLARQRRRRCRTQ
jgi:hypothetical protein